MYVENVPIIFAWGVNKKLIPLAKKAMDRIGDLNPIGILKEGEKTAFYHPLPRSSFKQEEWVENVVRVIKTKK